jgi:hypothetical protein
MALVNGRGIVEGHTIAPHAYLSGVSFRYCDLRGADLYESDLSHAKMEKAKLNYAKLHGANLHLAELKGVDFCKADLYKADLTDADLTEAYLVGADLRFADLRGATLTRAWLVGADLREAKVDAHQVPLIEAACRDMINSLKVGRDRTPNPNQPHSWGPHHDSYYDHPSVRDHVALRITPAGRRHLESSQGPSFHLTILERLSQVPSLPQFVLEGELGGTVGGAFGERSLSGAMVHSLCEEGLIEAFIEDKPARPRAIEHATEYSDDDHNLEYQHREMLRRRNPGHHRYGR